MENCMSSDLSPCRTHSTIAVHRCIPPFQSSDCRLYGSLQNLCNRTGCIHSLDWTTGLHELTEPGISFLIMEGSGSLLQSTCIHSDTNCIIEYDSLCCRDSVPTDSVSL